MLAFGMRKARSPNPHDVQLIKRFRNTFDRSDIDFLTQHNFADNWHVTRTKCFEDIADDWLAHSSNSLIENSTNYSTA